MSLLANLPMRLCYLQFPIVLQPSSLGYPKTTLLCLSIQLNSSVMHVVWVSAISQISFANVTSMHPPTLQRVFLPTVSTPCMKNYQRQGHTPPPGAVLRCFPRRLQPIITLFYRHCHGCWFIATLNWTYLFRGFLKVYPPLPFPHFHNCKSFPASFYWTFLIVPPL